MVVFQNQKQDYGLFNFKLGILLFWGIWFSIAFLTNMTDFLMTINIMSVSSVRSGNYNALEKVISIYNTPHDFLNILFSLDIFAQGLSAILFFIATFCFWKRIYIWQTINTAFSISIFLWAIFLIMEEIFIAYSYETTHITLFMFELISLIALHLLPHSTSKR